MNNNLDEIADRLKRYLQQSSIVRDPVTAVKAISDGYSNRTLLVEGPDLILRMPPEGEPLLATFGVHDVPTQYHIMQALSEAEGAPPVPNPVVLETDSAVLGSPFYLMEKVQVDGWGDFTRPDWLNNADEAFRNQVSTALVQNYIDLHALQPLAAFGPVRSAGEELQRWYQPIQSIISTTLEEAFNLLLKNLPEEQAPCPCHGDAKVANLLWKDGTVVAMVDYEMGFNGDPRWDIAALLQSMRSEDGMQPLAEEDEKGFWGRKHIISHWQDKTGRTVDQLTWFEAADRARYAALLLHGQWLFDQGKAGDPRYGQLGAIAERLSDTALSLARDVFRQ